MPKTILMMLLVVVSGSAAAEWAQVGANETSTFYADPAGIRHADSPVKMWDLLDFRAAQSRPYGAPYWSQKTLREYDCKEQRTRKIDLLRYSENMGEGEVAYTDSDPGNWEPVHPSTVSRALWEFACAQR